MTNPEDHLDVAALQDLKEIMEDTTHSIFIGEIQDLIHNEASIPLIYQEGKYV